MAAWPEYEAALKAAGVTYEGHIYPGAVHGFNNDATPQRYNKAGGGGCVTNEGWKRTVARANKSVRGSSRPGEAGRHPPPSRAPESGRFSRTRQRDPCSAQAKPPGRTVWDGVYTDAQAERATARSARHAPGVTR